jgi:hypothetical protein
MCAGHSMLCPTEAGANSKGKRANREIGVPRKDGGALPRPRTAALWQAGAKWWRAFALPGVVRQGPDNQIVTEVLFRLRVALNRISSAEETDRPTANAIGTALIAILRRWA